MDLLSAMRTFRTVVELESFSAAARQLDLVNSAVSRQVAELERHFGCQLLYRTTRAMHLTSEGKYYLEQFNEVLTRLDGLESRSRQQEGRIAGRLRITAPTEVGKLGIHRDVTAFLHRHPEVEISWLLVNRFVNLVEEGIDLAIRVGPLEDSGLIARHYDDTRVKLVASPDFLAAHGMPAHPRELARLPCVIDSSNLQPGRWSYRDGDRERQVSVTGNIEANLGELAAEFAAAGLGITRLPDFLVCPYLETGELLSVLEPFELPPLPVSLVYPANRIANPVLKALVGFLMETRERAP